jgi:hypothetical protein
LGWIGAPHPQNLETLENSGTKKNKIIFGIFVKMLDGSNFGKRCILGCYLYMKHFSDLENWNWN